MNFRSLANNSPLFISFLTFFSMSLVCIAQQDFSSRVQAVSDLPGSTALSVFDTSPESPDGQWICFTYYRQAVKGGHDATPAPVEVMAKNRITGKVRKLVDAEATNHNGTNAIWINDSLVAMQVQHQKSFQVVNVNNQQALYKQPIEGELPHKSFENVIYFSRCNQRRLSRNTSQTPYASSEEGIYRLNVLDGAVSLVVDKSTIIAAFQEQNPEITSDTFLLLHVEPNPVNEKILFDFRYRTSTNERPQQLLGAVDAKGSNVKWIPVRPMHVVWYDAQEMMGVDVTDAKKNIYRYNLQGEKLELLAGSACHMGASPEREWYVGEWGYYRQMSDGYFRVFLYQRGQTEPIGMLSKWKNWKVTLRWVAHVNPSFSSDGNRAYFIRTLDGEDRFQAVYIDLSKLKL